MRNVSCCLIQVFNMGHRMEIYVPSQAVADSIIRISQELGVEAQVVGAWAIGLGWHVCPCMV